MSFYDDAEFKKLQKVWYKKLKEEGFQDIEYSEDSDVLRGYSPTAAIRDNKDFFEKRRYYQLALQWAYKLENEWEPHNFYPKYAPAAKVREVWRLHAEGASYRKITQITGVGTVKVCKIVQTQARKMLRWNDSA